MITVKKLTRISAAVLAALSISPVVLAHETYDLTMCDYVSTNLATATAACTFTPVNAAGLTIADSVNNSDGIANANGYGPVGTGTPALVNGNPNADIPGTGGLPADYYGKLPYMLYSGHHDVTVPAVTLRQNLTGLSTTSGTTTTITANSIWKAFDTQNSTALWGPFLFGGPTTYPVIVPPATTLVALPVGAGSSATNHPYVAVGGKSWVAGSTTGGLDYNLIHASGGANVSTANNGTAAVPYGGWYEISITVKRDSAYDSVNDSNALLDVALFRGADSSTTASRTAAFNVSTNPGVGTGIGGIYPVLTESGAVTLQNSTLGTGTGGAVKIWQATQSATTDTLTYKLIIDQKEWAATDAVNGAPGCLVGVKNSATTTPPVTNGCLDDSVAGYYTLVVGAHGGATGSAVAYTVDTLSYSRIPEKREDNNNDLRADILWYNKISPFTGAGYGSVYELLLEPNAATPPPFTLVGQFAGVPIPDPWSIKGRGDYDGDGQSDILWSNDQTATAYSLPADSIYIALRTPAPTVPATAPAGAYTLPAAGLSSACAPATSVVVGTGACNNDNHSDILLKNSSGNINLLLMSGTTILNPATTLLSTIPACAATFATPPTATSVVSATGDYNGDGKADILWSDSGTDKTYVQLTGVTGFTTISGLTGFTIQGSGYYDTDAKSDIIFRNAAGDVYIKNNITATGPGTLVAFNGGNVPTAWVVKGTGDYNGDGVNDILWRNEAAYNATTNPYSGYNYVFLMNGAALGTLKAGSDFLPVPYNYIPTNAGWDIAYTVTQ